MTTKTKGKEENHAKDQAQAQFESIKEMLENIAKAGDNDEAREEAEETLRNDPLSVEVKKCFEILLCWGGPACRIVGELDEHGEPEDARLQYQDWFTSWTEYPCNEETLLDYARNFYFDVA